MSDQNPAATPAAPVAPATPAPSTPPAVPPAGTPPVVPPGNGANPDGSGEVKIPLKEYKQLQRDAARGRSPKNQNLPSDRINDRYNQPASDPDDDQATAELRSQVATKDRELLQERLNNKVRDLLETNEYKDLPLPVKQWVKINPIALVDPRARSLDDALADIKDRLDEARDSVTTPAPAAPGVTTPSAPETPPVNGSTPAPAGANTAESVDGKTGAARSVAVLKNMFKAAGIKK